MWVVQAEAMLGRRDRAAAYLEMLSPVSHATDPGRLAVYQVEPYVIAADVYGVAPHLGRGGWTWYTGSAGWMYRIALERVLGIRVEGGETLLIDPRIPDEWPGFSVELSLHGGACQCEIAVENPTHSASRVASVTVDGQTAAVLDGIGRVPLRRDGVRHRVRVVLA
jgi:cyclic beta-1,2-glucan synthetase